MKKFKSVYRYVLVGLPLALFTAVTVYAQVVLNKLNAFIHGPKYIELALRSTEQAEAYLVRRTQFENVRGIGLPIALGFFCLLAIMIVCDVLAHRWAKKGRNPIKAFFANLKTKTKTKPQAAPVKKPDTQAGFCPNCGTPYDKPEGFCAECGCNLAEK